MLQAHELRRVAVEGEVAPGTVARYLAGLPIRGLSRTRIERALLKLGIGVKRQKETAKAPEPPLLATRHAEDLVRRADEREQHR